MEFYIKPCISESIKHFIFDAIECVFSIRSKSLRDIMMQPEIIKFLSARNARLVESIMGDFRAILGGDVLDNRIVKQIE